ncbi:DUF4124 domain-containing protein [Piscinibacter sp. XHJ-5]|uniref:DUF4124 domain-containing protein n=1 Tax=Piscinibacter sp. XHJ-5 TaxID=3037797 RepID=UPI0024531B25|nr:DUF4124 domain-containing protein [Piscinibacter sp. XHJ-5]
MRLLGYVAGLMLTFCAGHASAAIYSCIDANGKKLTSDRPIVECANRDQRVLNPDGSVKRVLPPTPTADERAEQEARERQAAADRVAQQDAIRRDRNLMVRFPNEAAHNKQRAKALDDVRNAVAVSEKRLAALAAERKPLVDEAEFYVGRAAPLKLRQQLDANDAATDAQKVLIQNQQAEIVRINALYDAELARLKKLWAGAAPGSMGALPSESAASDAKKTAAK